MDIHEIIVNAKLGSARKDAQIDACTAFASALSDFLNENQITHEAYTVSYLLYEKAKWYHAVIKVEDFYYDSLGLFNDDLVNQRSKIHKNVLPHVEIVYKKDVVECDPDFEEMRSFFLKKLNLSLKRSLKIAA